MADKRIKLPMTRQRIEQWVNKWRGMSVKNVPFGARACDWLLKELDKRAASTERPATRDHDNRCG